MKTLSLRIRGVKTELEEAGLETEGMAETTSQLQAKLKALTDGKVDIMVDANNFKSTTQIIREMAAEWENMEGIERSAALELLGGKRQANVLSALISNFDIVEDAIEASANSAGSALEENEKVLDSIQGRINLFNNALETMWNNLLDDEWIKLIVDVGTELVKLIDKFGALRTILFGILTYYSVFKKDNLDLASVFGIHDIDKGWTFGKEGATGWIAEKLFPNKQASIQKIEQDIDEITNAAEARLHQNITEMQDGQFAFDFDNIMPQQQTSKYFDIYTKGIDSKQTLQIDNLELFSQELDKLNNLDNAGVLSYMQSLGDLGEESGNTAQALAAYAATVTDGNYSAQAGIQYVEQHNAKIKASGIAAKGAAIGHAALNAAISMGISILISWVVSAVTKAINANKELAESVEEVMTEYNRATKTLKDHRDTLDEIDDDYAKLASGVDALGRNVSLSTDEYERYNEIVNSIAEMFPEMVSGYTEEGNAIIALKGNVEALEKAYEAEAKAARDALIIASNDTFTNFKNNTKENTSWWHSQSKMDELAFFKELTEGNTDASYWRSEVSSSAMDEWLQNAGIDSTNWLSSDETFEEAFEENKAQIKAYYDQLRIQIEAESTPLNKTVSAFLEEDLDYQKLSDEGKNIAQAIISGFDTEFYARDEFEEWSDVTTWIDENVVQKLQNTDNMAEFNAAFGLQTQFNDGDVPVGDYISQIEEFLKLLEELGFDEEIVKTVRAVFDIDDYKTKMESAKEILDDAGDSQVGTLSKSDLDIIDKNKTEWKEELEIDGQTVMSWDELINKIEETKAVAWEASIEFDKLSDQIDGIQDAYTALSDAVTQYNEKGYLTLDNLQALLSLEPEYLAALQMENGQLVLNQSVLETLIQAKLAEAKATAVQSAITQLNELATRNEADAIVESANAAANSISNLGSYASALNGVTQEAIGAAGAVMAFNAAVQGAQSNELVTQAEIDAIMSNLDTQIALIDSVGANLGTNFKGIVSPSKSSSSSSEKDDRLEKLQKKYERKISNLDNQQEYLENEIERLEAEDKGVSKSYYEEQIRIEEQKMALLQQEKAELNKLLKSTAEGSDEWYEVAEALWEVELAVQESTLRTIEFRKSIADLYKTAFDELDDVYGEKDDLYSDRQAYIESYMELLELQGKSTPVSAYMGLIAEEEAKMANSIAELNDLRKVLAEGMADGSIEEGDEVWIDMQSAIRDTEAAILDSKVAIEQYKKEIEELWAEVFDGLDRAYGYKDNLYSDRQAYIEKYAELLELQGQAVPASAYMDLIAEEEAKLANSTAELASLKATMAASVASGSVKVGDENWVEMNESIRETEASILDSKIAIEEYKKELKELQVEAFELVREAFSNRNDYYTHQQDYIEGYIDYLEATGVDATPEIYEKLIEIEKDKRENNLADLADARIGLTKLEAAGYTAADEEWVDANNRIVELEKSIQDSDIAMAEWEKTIREMEFEKFDQFAERVANLNKELDNVYKLVEDEDVAFDDGTWTKEGITALSMLYHQIENNNKMIEEYNEELAKLEKQYKSGEISEKEYAERAEELKDNQWELIHTNEDLKDSIIDINEARIDLVEEGINEEIDAYRELIELKKEELDAERDLYDFRRNIEKQTKEISELERKIAGLSGSDDAADVAERRKLEAQLREAQDGLNNTYYDHSKDNQSLALDDELEAYEKTAEDYVESLREKLENVDAMIEQTLSDVLFNADVTYQGLIELSNIYGVTLSENLMNPWYQMSNQATATKDKIGEDLLLLNEDNIAPFSEYAGTLLTAPFENGGSACVAFKDSTMIQIAEIETRVYAASSNLTRDLVYPWNATAAPINTFSTNTEAALTGAVTSAQAKAQATTDAVTRPWKSGAESATTFSKTSEAGLNKALADAHGDVAAMTDYLTAPWRSGVNAVNTWSSTVESAYDDAVKKAQESAKAINAANASINTPNHNTDKSAAAAAGAAAGAGVAGAAGAAQKNTKSEPTIYSVYGITNSQVSALGYGPLSLKGFENKLRDYEIGLYYVNGKPNVRKASALEKRNKHLNQPPVAVAGPNAIKKHAKGTLGTKRDEWAYTDEPWLGDEIVLIPGANGNLQYMRKGTAVMPADISANLVEWGKINPDMTALSNGIQGVTLMSNYVSKPEIKLNIDNFLRCDNVSQESLPELKKFVNEQMNSLVKQLNYGLKRSGA